MLMVSMSLLLVVFGSVFGGLFGAMGAESEILLPSIILGAVVATAVALIATAWSYFGGSKAILRMANANEIQKEDDPQLFNVVEELSIAAGVPMPKIFIIDEPALNAFATGRDPEHGVVAITTGLRDKLSRDELAAVMAHELSHIRHYDIRFNMIIATMVGLIVFASDAFRRMVWYGGMHSGRRTSGRHSSSGGRGGGNPAVAIFFILALLLSIIAPILAMVIRFAISREREYLADAGAVELTRYPQGMISALEKLEADSKPMRAASRATQHMFIINPMKGATTQDAQRLSSTFRTHPPIKDRVARLRALIE